MISPARQLPTASNLKVSVIAICCVIVHDLRNMEMHFLNVNSLTAMVAVAYM
jgi:hypothetical protein